MRLLSFCGVVLLTTSAGSQAPTLPPIRRLSPPVATSKKTFGRIMSIRALPNGRVLVNDFGTRRLVLTDTSLANMNVVADTTSANATQYGARPAGLMPYLGDSTLFVEATTPAMYVIGPAGAVVRTLSVPSPRDAGAMIQGNYNGGSASTDALGRIVYKKSAPREAPAKHPIGEVYPFSYPDTISIVRVDPVSRKVETLAWYKGYKTSGFQYAVTATATRSFIKEEPLPTTEDWAVLADGTIAILRADYHLELLGADGGITRTPRIPYPWERLTEEMKVAFVDSLRKADETPATPTSVNGGSGAAASFGGATGGSAPSTPGEPDAVLLKSLVAAKVSELPDYRPAFTQAGLMADAVNNLWIKTLQPARTPNVAIYDVVSKTGTLVDRIELPADRTVVGFDRSAVYLVARDDSGSWLERVRIR